MEAPLVENSINDIVPFCSSISTPYHPNQFLEVFSDLIIFFIIKTLKFENILYSFP